MHSVEDDFLEKFARDTGETDRSVAGQGRIVLLVRFTYDSNRGNLLCGREVSDV